MISRKNSHYQASEESSKILEAVGISYDEDKDAAPVISSKGEGAMADAIVAMANELGIYVHRDERLLQELKCLKEGAEIPRELFEVIATILAFSYMLQGKTPHAWTRSRPHALRDRLPQGNLHLRKSPAQPGLVLLEDA